MNIASLNSREEIPALLKERGLTGWGVEVGTHTGWFSDKLLRGSDLSTLFSVDTWHESEPGLPVGMGSIDCFQLAARTLWEHYPRSVMIRKESTVAAELFPDKSLDFVYIDANHDYPHVVADILAWYPKMKPGGLFCGHDYNLISPEVRQAVSEFVSREKLTLYLTELDFIHEGQHEIRSWLTMVPHG